MGEIEYSHWNKNKIINVDYLMEWLSKPPKYTTFRINNLRRNNFDVEIMKNFLKQQKQEINATDLPNVYLLRPDCLVVEQWPENEDIKPTGKEVIVDAICAAAVLRGAHVYAPGVKGLPTNIQLNDVVDVYADLKGTCKRGLKVSFNGEKLFVGTGYLKKSRRDLFDDNVKPSGIAVHITRPSSRLPVLNENLYPKGDVLLQNLPSIVCGWVVDAQPGDIILDMCSAPGNKTTHLAEMSHDQAYIIAIDKSQTKIDKVKESCKTHGVTCVHSYVFDSTKCFSDGSKDILNGPPFPENSFDKILLDAPCSGLGQRPQLHNKMSPKILDSYKFVQRKLMATATKLLKVGGKLVYSTCTVTKDENEGMVTWVLNKFPCMKLIASEPLLGGPGWPDCGLTDKQRLLVQRFGPENDNLRIVEDMYKDTIGFFIATFTKTL